MDSPASISLSQTEHTLAPAATINSSFSKCTYCNVQQKENPRNLVVCIDVTSTTSDTSTNVGRLFAKIDQKTTHSFPEQHVVHSSEFGKSLISNRMKKTFDFNTPLVASDIKKIIKDAYRWLAERYQEGDQIYLFGFSRGAYQVRVLAGMIHEVGLIKTCTEVLITTAYEYYEAIRSGQPKTRQIVREFKNAYSWKDSRVHFVGVWDAVSVGSTRADVFLSTSESSAPHACHFRHALALDEDRVNFIPDYIHQINSLTDDGKSKYIVTSPDLEHAATPGGELHEPIASENGVDTSGGRKNKRTEIKEVWFAGSHSDVGGKNRRRKSHHAGNVSLLWMRREAAACGLVLKPTDVVWLPDDLDFGISNSITPGSRVLEYMPIDHQVSFSGFGEHARCQHLLQPRRIIPGQKVHASILYAHAYEPRASLGEGFEIPVLRAGLDTELDDQIWEMGLFDDTAAQDLVTELCGGQGTVPMLFDRLLFMLRFEEGRQCLRNVPDWENKLMGVIQNRDYAPLARLVAVVAYYEASCVVESQRNPAQLDDNLVHDIFNDAKQSLRLILNSHKHQDGSRVVALLRPLTKHAILRQQILTQDVLEVLVGFFDSMISRRGEDYERAMDGLNCILLCEDTQSTIIDRLGEVPRKYNVSRLCRILEVNDPRLLTVALCMIATLSRIPQARAACSEIKPRIRELVVKSKRPISVLALEILLILYDQNEQEKLNGCDACILGNALIHLNPDLPTCGQQIQTLRQIFGLDTNQLTQPQKNLIGGLKVAVQKGNARKRVDATFTLLRLCESKIIRTHLLEIDLLNDFVNQLRYRDTALLAAYALAICIKDSEMRDSVVKENDNLPKNIIRMLRLDYFDDAVGQMEGFQIFGDLMQHVELREKIRNDNITDILIAKLSTSKIKAIRTGLICLDIFRSYVDNSPWTSELVEESLERLRNRHWMKQKAGVTILSALAQTEHGIAAIGPKIYEIIEMLLPEGDLPVQATTPGTNSAAGSPKPSRMMGPACALRVLAQNKVLRDRTRNTMQYDTLKQLFLSGTLVGETDAEKSSIWTPIRSDIIHMLAKVIEAVDDELSETYLISIGDVVLPHIQHWDRLGALAVMTAPLVALPLLIPPWIALGIALGAAEIALIIPAAVVLGPLGLLWTSIRNKISRDRWSEREGEFNLDEHASEVVEDASQA